MCGMLVMGCGDGSVMMSVKSLEVEEMDIV